MSNVHILTIHIHVSLFLLEEENEMKRLVKSKVTSKGILAQVYILKKVRTFLAVLGILGMLWSYVPWNHINALDSGDLIENSSSEVSDSLDGTDEQPQVDDPTTSEIEIVDEVVGERTSNSKTFMKNDGTYEIAIYNEDIHYLKNGKYVDIDNSLEEKIDGFENKSNRYKIKFPKVLDDNKSIKLRLDDYSISWSLDNIESSDIKYDTNQVENISKKILENLNQRVLYTDILDNVSLQYDVFSNEVKESIILDTFIEDFSLDFQFDLKGLQIEERDGKLVFVDNQSVEIFWFDNLFMEDSAGGYSEDIVLSYEKIGNNKYTVSITPNNEWLENASYPVIIDPTIVLHGVTNDINDRYTYGTSSYNDSSNKLIVGKKSSEIYRSYLELDLSDFAGNENREIKYAHMHLQQRYTDYPLFGRTYYGSFTSDFQINAFKVDDGNSLSTLIGNGSYTDGKIIDYEFGIDSKNDTRLYTWDLTKAVHEWVYDNRTSGIIELKSNDELAENYIEFFSTADTYNSPIVEIGYINTQGINEYWTYNTQSVDLAGTGYVSDFTGMLTFARNDISFQTERQSLNLGFYFNNGSSTNNGYGSGWMPNYYLTYFYDENSDYNSYILNPSGNKVYYQKHKFLDYAYCDSIISGLQLGDYECLLAQDGSGSIMIVERDSSGNQTKVFLKTKELALYEFNTTTKSLKSIKDIRSNQEVEIFYTNTIPKKIDYIEDESQNKILFFYDSGFPYNLNKIELRQKVSSTSWVTTQLVDYTNSSGKLVEVKYYTDYANTNTYLSTIDSNLDFTVTYSYTSTGLLDTAVTSSGKKIDYDYMINSRKIDDISIYMKEGSVDTLVGTQNYSYSYRKTRITNQKQEYMEYVFDNYGRTNQKIDSEGNVQTYEYLDIFSPLEQVPEITTFQGQPNYWVNNAIYQISNVFHYVENPIKTHSFEAQDITKSNWDYYQNGSLNTTYNYLTTADKKTGSKSAKIQTNSSLKQIAQLDEGLYTLSVWIKNGDLNTESKVEIITSTDSFSEVIGSNTLWKEYKVFFEVTSETDNVIIKLENIDSANVYFDNVQITPGYGTSTANLIENSSFEYGLLNDNWTFPDTPAYITNRPGTDYSEILGDKSVKMLGDAKTLHEMEIDLSSDVIIEGYGVYVMSLWSYSESTPLKTYIDGTGNNSYDRVAYNALIEYVSNGVTYTKKMYFDPQIEGWQNKQVEIVNPSNYEITSLKIKLQYKGEGAVYFDGIQLSKGTYGTTYTYNEIGQIETTKNSYRQTSTYEYTDAYGNVSQTPTKYTTDKTETSVIYNSDYLPEKYLLYNTTNTLTYNSNGQVTESSYGRSSSTFSSHTHYTLYDQYVSSEVDFFGETENYYYTLTGLLDHYENKNGDYTFYTYDHDGSLKTVMSRSYCTLTNECSMVEYVYDENTKQLTEIKVEDGYSYKLQYDSYGRLEEALVNNNSLVTNTYVDSSGYPSTMLWTKEYANGDKIRYEYDDEDQLEYVYYSNPTGGVTEKKRFEYKYDNLGRIGEYLEYDSGGVNNYSERYVYNEHNQLECVIDSDGNTTTYIYGDDGVLKGFDFEIAGDMVSYDYDRDEEEYYIGSPDTMSQYNEFYDETTITTENAIIKRDYDYEKSTIDRLYMISTLSNNVPVFTQYFNYTGESLKISETHYYKSNNEYSYSYVYDSIGNITQEVYNHKYLSQSETEITTTYEYDEMNQLIKESRSDGSVCDTVTETCYTKVYRYDYRGNITDYLVYKYEEDQMEEITPLGYRDNNGSSILSVYVDGYTYIQVGETLDLSFDFRDAFTNQSVFAFYVCNTVNTSQAGYHLLECSAQASSYDLDFGIVITVGTPPFFVDAMPEEHFVYEYSNVWQDQLSKVYEAEHTTVSNYQLTELQSFTYDDLGNPIEISNYDYYYNSDISSNYEYDSITLEYEGRELTGINYVDSTYDNVNIEYTYNDSGIRTSKTVNGDTTHYKLNGDYVIFETDGTYNMFILYDINNSVIGFSVQPGGTGNYIDYFYIKNLQGDITKIVDSNGNVMVEYLYDAWGNILEEQYESSNNSAQIAQQYNRYFYRGYRLDRETNLYYLNSRYYSPQIRRFINADGLMGEQGNVLGHNMYAYCQNNPVMYSDISGYFWNLAIGAFIGAAVGFTFSVGSQMIAGGEINWGLVMVATGAGAVSGLIASTGIGVIGSGIAGGVLGGAQDTASQLVMNGGCLEELDFLSIGVSTGIGIVAGLISGSGYQNRSSYHMKVEIDNLRLINTVLPDSGVASQINNILGKIGYQTVKDVAGTSTRYIGAGLSSAYFEYEKVKRLAYD